MAVNSKDFQIDVDNLDKEWTAQPSLYSKYAKATADARREMDEAKTKLDVTKAEVAVLARREPEKFGLSKITEASLSQIVECNLRVKGAMEEVMESRHHYEVLQAAVGAMDHKKKALESLVSLFLADYFSQPRAKGATKEKVEDMEKQSVRRKR